MRHTRICICLSLFFCANALAGGIETKKKPIFNGPYIGAGAGVIVNDSTIKRRSSVSAGIFNNDISPDRATNSISAIGNLAIGYGVNWKRFYCAAEISADVMKDEVKTDTNKFTDLTTPDTLSNNATIDNHGFSYNVDLMPGALISPESILYARVGLAVNRITLAAQSIASSPGVSPFTLNNSTTKTRTGTRIGIGMERLIGNRMFLSVDYIYTYYGHQLTDAVLSNGATTINNSSDAIIHDQKVMLGLVYRPFTNTKDNANYGYAIYHGFYVGIGGGILENIFDTEGVSEASGADTINLTSDHNSSNTKLAGTVFVGYSIHGEDLYLGAEFGTTMSDNTLETFDSGFNAGNGESLSNQIQLKLNKIDVHFDILPGFLLEKSAVIYGRFGLVSSKIDINMITTDLDNPGGSGGILYQTNSKQVIGLRAGGGIAQTIARNLQVRLDYVYNYYRDIDISGTLGVTGGAVISGRNHVTVRNQVFLASLVYQIGS